MHRISAEIRQQSRRPLKEDDDPRVRDDEDGDDGDLAEEGGVVGAHAKPSQRLYDHLDHIELYMPPLSSSLLKAAWASKARDQTREREEDRVTSSTRAQPALAAST